MSLELIKKYVSDKLNTKLISSNDSRDGKGFNAHFDGKIIHIFMSAQFISSIERSENPTEDLKGLNILTFMRENPGANIAINSDRIIIDSFNR